MPNEGLLGLGIIDTEKGLLGGVVSGQRPIIQKVEEAIPAFKTSVIWGSGATLGSFVTNRIIDRVMDLVIRLRI